MATDDTQDERQDDDRGKSLNRYDYDFRNLEAHHRVNPMKKVGYAKAGLFAHRANGFGADDDEAIVRQFDLSGMAEFWEIELSEPMTCAEFTRSLARHFYKIDWRPGLSAEEMKRLGPAAERVNDSVEVGIRQALRKARSYDKPWFMVIPDPPPSNKIDRKALLAMLPDTVVVSPDPPVDGIDLNKLRVDPRAAAEWMLSNAMRRHLVPPSLAAVLSASEREKTVQTGVDRPGASSDKPAAAASSEQVAVPKVPVLTPEVSARNGRISDGELNNYVAALSTDPQLFCPDVIDRVQREFGDRAPGVNKIKRAYKLHYKNPVRAGQSRRSVIKSK